MAEQLSHDVVTDVALYPGKSFRRATVDGELPLELAVGPTGFEAYGVRDRDFVLAYGDPANAAFASQRGWGAHSRKVEHPGDRLLATVAVDIRSDHVAFSAPGFGTLQLPTELVDGQDWTVNVFGKQFFGVDQGAEAADFFTRFLRRSDGPQRELHLLRADRAHPRWLPERYRRGGASNQVSGADGMPFLLASEASLAELHRQKGLPAGSVAIGRYRPNIVISGEAVGPWAEDRMDYVRLGDMGAYVVKACSRCPIPNTDQVTGEYDGASSKLLTSRAGEIFTGEKGIFFAQNLNHEYSADTPATVGVRDAVQVLRWAPEPNVELRAGK